MKAEREIKTEIQLAASEDGYRLFNNPVGLFYTKIGTPVRCGLAKGSSDLIGIGPGGRILCVETKTKIGKERDEQIAWRKMINSLGGIAFTARSVDEYRQKMAMHR